MRCDECGAEKCRDRYHDLLAAEWENPEAAAMHGLFVLVYHVQHPSLCRPWIQSAQREWLHRISFGGLDWREVLAWPKDRKLRQQSVIRAKERLANDSGSHTTGHPIEGEMTIVDLPAPGSPGYPREYPEKIEAWAKSVAEHRLT